MSYGDKIFARLPVNARILKLSIASLLACENMEMQSTAVLCIALACYSIPSYHLYTNYYWLGFKGAIE